MSKSLQNIKPSKYSKMGSRSYSKDLQKNSKIILLLCFIQQNGKIALFQWQNCRVFKKAITHWGQVFCLKILGNGIKDNLISFWRNGILEEIVPSTTPPPFLVQKYYVQRCSIDSTPGTALYYAEDSFLWQGEARISL